MEKQDLANIVADIQVMEEKLDKLEQRQERIITYLVYLAERLNRVVISQESDNPVEIPKFPREGLDPEGLLRL